MFAKKKEFVNWAVKDGATDKKNVKFYNVDRKSESHPRWRYDWCDGYSLTIFKHAWKLHPLLCSIILKQCVFV